MLTNKDEYEIAQMALNYEETLTEIGKRYGVDRKVVSRRKNKYLNLNGLEKELSDYFKRIHTIIDSLFHCFSTNELADFIFDKKCDHIEYIAIYDHVDSWRKDQAEYNVGDLENLINEMQNLEDNIDAFESEEPEKIEKNKIIEDIEGVVDWSNAPDSSYNYFFIEKLNSYSESDFHKKEYNNDFGQYIYVDKHDCFYSEDELDYVQTIYKKPESNNALREDVVDKDFGEDQEVDVEYDAVITPSSIDITKQTLKGNDEIETDQRVISSGNPQFKKAWQIIRENQGELNQGTLQKVYEVADIRSYIGKITEGNLVIDFDNETAYYKNYPIDKNMVRRIIQEAFDENTNQVNRKIVNFFEKVLDNPSERSVNNLYDFLKHNDIKIDENGDIIGYKMVRPDRYDQFSGTIWNGDNERIWMPRHEVDCDPNHTCSRGLHICASKYLGFFNGTITIKVRVNPRDVCAVPYDYDGAKMRVNHYTVIGALD